jgi:hypothetical protein
MADPHPLEDLANEQLYLQIRGEDAKRSIKDPSFTFQRRKICKSPVSKTSTSRWKYDAHSISTTRKYVTNTPGTWKLMLTSVGRMSWYCEFFLPFDLGARMGCVSVLVQHRRWCDWTSSSDTVFALNLLPTSKRHWMNWSPIHSWTINVSSVSCSLHRLPLLSNNRCGL